MKKINDISDYKIMSISISSLIILFTLIYFRYKPLELFNISISDLNNTILTTYNIITIITSCLLTLLFIISFWKKNDKDLKIRFKQIGIGIGAMVLYFLLPYLEGVPFVIMGVDTTTLPIWVKIFYLTMYSVLTASLIMIIYNKKISKDFKDMKKNSIKYFNKYIKYWLIGLFIMMVSNLFINLIVTNDIPSNEQAIRETFNISPLYIFFSAVIYAPIVEELIFRQSIKNIFHNKWLFIIISGLLFGSMHVFGDFKNITDLLYIIPYSTPGIIFAYMLEDSDNICVPMSFHFIHNGILISLQFILLLFG